MLRHRVLGAIILTVAVIIGGFSCRVRAESPNTISTASSTAIGMLNVPSRGSLQVFMPPVRIIIPTAKANVPIIPVGVTSKGQLDTPPNFTQAGWYQYGAIPGQLGSAVIDGHVDNGSTIPGPFKHLKDVQLGDKIQIQTVGSSTLQFTVVSKDVYKTQAFPSTKIFHDNSAPLLKIITCYGKFISSKKTYDQRLVVTAILDPQTSKTLALAY